MMVGSATSNIGLSRRLVHRLALVGLSLGLIALGVRGRAEDARRTEIVFRFDDAHGQQIAKQALANKIARDKALYAASGAAPPVLRTAWARLSVSEPSFLFVEYGCSPVGNCITYAFERTKSGWRKVLDSIAQIFFLLPSSHGGHRDICGSMHGSATEATIKTYWWRSNRYVRVSERDVQYR
ncbi:MAG: hypothetical protein ACREEH_08890 [Caulobacteraceae bacterium]